MELAGLAVAQATFDYFQNDINSSLNK